MAELKEILKDLLEDIKAAEKDITTAKELIAIGEEAGVDVSAEKRDIRDLERDIERFKKAVTKRLGP